MRLFFAFLVLFLGQNPSQNPNTQKETRHPKSNESASAQVPTVSHLPGSSNIETPTCKAEDKNAYDPRKDRLYRWYMRATIIGVAVGVLGIFVLFIQTAAIGSQSRALKRAERAHVDVEITLPESSKLVSHSVKLNNYGKSVAAISGYIFRHLSFPSELETAKYSEETAIRSFKDGQEINSLLPPQLPAKLGEVSIHTLLTQEEKTGKHIGVFYYTVFYADIFGEDHETEVAYKFDWLREHLENVPQFNRYT
jgi:hypothetical protein